MRILTLHNKYKIRGGEDEVCEAETAMLRAHGEEVRELIFDNETIGTANSALVAMRAIWSRESYRELSRLISEWRPEIVNVHNFFPLASPSIYYAAANCGVPIVQTLHNYRLICPGGDFLRNGAVCEKCLNKTTPWPAVVYGCYRCSRMASVSVASMLSVHSLIGTWNSKVNQYVLLTEFARNKFMEAGFPADRMVVRQNFVPYDLGPGKGDGGFVLYVGRLSREKGILELLRAWQDVRRGKLIIVGNGNLRSEVEEAAADSESIQYLGNQPLDRVFDLMGASRALVFPSIWYEGMPRVIIESFSRGTPVLASRMGSMEEMILPHQTGWLVTPGRVDELSSTLQMILEPQADWSRQRALARQEFERHYTADIAYQKTMEIYTETIARHMRERV